MKYKRKIALLLTLFIVVISCNGCWDKVEINSRGFVTAISIDKANENGKINVEVEIPNVALLADKSFGTKDSAFYFKGVGKDINSALDDIELSTPFKLDLSQTKAIIFSKELLNDSKLFEATLNAIRRENKISRRILLIASLENDAIKIKSKEQPLTGIYLYNLIKPEMEQGKVINSTINTVMRDFLENKTMIIPFINIQKEKHQIDIDGAVMIKDYKVIGHLNDRQLKILNLINKKTINPITIDLKNETDAILKVVRTDRNMKVNMGDDNKLHLKLDVFVEADITQDNLVSKDNKQLLNEQYKDQEKASLILKSEIEEVINSLQNEYHVDLIKVGDYMHKYNPSQYKAIESKFQEYFKDMNVDVNVKTKIRKKGIVR